MSIGTVTNQHEGTSKQGPSATQLLKGDTFVYLFILALLIGTWNLSKLELFKPGDDIGYWVGVAGGSMMLLLFTYPLRKHFRFSQSWGRLKWWFVFHMVLGIVGPILILLHSTFRIGSLNAGVALYSMLIVAFSGLIGRFIYARINRGLRGEQTDFQALQKRAGMDRQDARSRLAFAPEVEEQLKEFESTELSAPTSWTTHFRSVFWLPIRQWLVYRSCAKALQRSLDNLARHGAWSSQDTARRHAQARRLVRRYLTAVTRVAQFSAYERLFSLWHVAHIPFVYLMVISAIVHVIAVHAY